MIVAKIIIFTVMAILLSTVAGYMFLAVIRKAVGPLDRVGQAMHTGATLLIALGILSFGVGGLVNLSVQYCFVIYVFMIAILLLCGVIACRREKIKIGNYIKFTSSKFYIKNIFYMIIPALLVVWEIYSILYNSTRVSSVLKDVSCATYVFETGKCYPRGLIMNMWGCISVLMNEHPLRLIYYVLPIFMILYFYIGYYEIAMLAFGGDKKRAMVSVSAVAILNIWGYQSEILIPVTMLFSYFGTWCFVVNGLLPCITILLLCRRANGITASCDEKVEDNIVLEDDEDYEEEWDMKKHKLINARNLAIALGVLTVMLLGFVFVLNNKINNLHAATANLQADMDKRVSVYEFTAADGKSYGYLIKGRDGSLTMVGGGDIDRADDLYDFLKDYGTSITNWYLYDGNEENTGACVKCMYEKGIEVENIYVLNRMEIEGL